LSMPVGDAGGFVMFCGVDHQIISRRWIKG